MLQNEGIIDVEEIENEGNMQLYALNNLTLVEERKAQRLIYSVVKRFFDILVSASALLLLSPLFIAISLAVKLDSKGKVFFKHKRIGKNGQPLEIYKFRTMVENAEELLKKLTPEQKEEYEKNYKLDNDFRITRIGSFLRKTSLDELPQLINILKGDMSLIGPRPVVEKEIEKYGFYQDRFLSVTPGLTGYWAANGRSCTSYEERIQMELYYVQNYSLGLDLEIFFKTIESVLKGHGAK